MSSKGRQGRKKRNQAAENLKDYKISKPHSIFLDDSDEDEVDELLTFDPFLQDSTRLSSNTNNTNNNNNNTNNTNNNTTTINNNNTNNSQTTSTSNISAPSGESSPQSSVASHTSSSSSNSSSKNSTEKADTAALETKARARIAKDQEAHLHYATVIKHKLGDLKWHVVPNKQGSKSKGLCLPCRICPEDEAKHVGLKKSHNKTFIQYIGFNVEASGQYSNVFSSQLKPLLDPETNTIPKEYMSSFENYLRTMKEYQLVAPPAADDDNEGDNTRSNSKATSVDEFKVVLERCILEKLVELCRTCMEDDEGKENDLLIDKTEENDKLAEDDDDDGDGRNFSQQMEEDVEREPAQSSTTNSSGDDSDDNNSTSYLNKTKPRTKQTIQAGCVVAYDDPIAVAGNKIKTSTVWQVDRKGEEFVLTMEDGEFLNRESRVKLLMKKFRGKLMENENPIFQAVKKYRLKDSVLEGEDPSQKKVNAMNVSLQSFQSGVAAAADSGNNGASMFFDMMRPIGVKKKHVASTMNPSTPVANAEMQDAGPSPTGTCTEDNLCREAKRRKTCSGTPRETATETPRRQQTAKTPTYITEEWWNDTNNRQLKERSDELKNAINKRASSNRGRRSGVEGSHKMSAEQLDIAIQARNCLEAMVNKACGEETVTSILIEFVNACDEEDSNCLFDDLRVQRFLSGDPNALNKKIWNEQISTELAKWLEKQEWVDSPAEAPPTYPQADDQGQKVTPKQPKQARTKQVQKTHAIKKCNSVQKPSRKSVVSTKKRRKTLGGQELRERGQSSLPYKNEGTRKRKSTHDDAWLQHSSIELLEKMVSEIESQENTLSQRRTKQHHMSPKQLKVAIQVRKRLNEMAVSSTSAKKLPVGDIIEQELVSETNEISFEQLKCFLTGDHNKLVHKDVLEIIEIALNQWLLQSTDTSQKYDDTNKLEAQAATVPIHKGGEDAIKKLNDTVPPKLQEVKHSAKTSIAVNAVGEKAGESDAAVEQEFPNKEKQGDVDVAKSIDPKNQPSLMHDGKTSSSRNLGEYTSDQENVAGVENNVASKTKSIVTPSTILRKDDAVRGSNLPTSIVDTAKREKKVAQEEIGQPLSSRDP